MRTTLTLDPDVARMVADEVHRQRKPFKQVVNEALRRGLAPQEHQGEVHSNDTDFGRFRGLRWINPLR